MNEKIASAAEESNPKLFLFELSRTTLREHGAVAALVEAGVRKLNYRRKWKGVRLRMKDIAGLRVWLGLSRTSIYDALDLLREQEVLATDKKDPRRYLTRDLPEGDSLYLRLADAHLDISPTAKVVLAEVRRCQKYGCKRKEPDLAKFLGLKLHALKRAKRSLEEIGAITIICRKASHRSSILHYIPPPWRETVLSISAPDSACSAPDSASAPKFPPQTQQFPPQTQQFPPQTQSHVPSYGPAHVPHSEYGPHETPPSSASLPDSNCLHAGGERAADGEKAQKGLGRGATRPAPHIVGKDWHRSLEAVELPPLPWALTNGKLEDDNQEGESDESYPT